MTIIRNFDYNSTQITAMDVDTSNGEYLWVGFAQNASGVCKLKKVSAHDPSQVYFDIDLSVTEITAIYVFGSYVYVAVSDSTYLWVQFSTSSPLTSYNYVTLPSGETEAPVDIIDDGTYVYFLMPGSVSGINSKIYKYSTARSLITTINLSTIIDASSFTIDDSDNIWVVTNESPSDLVRVYTISGGIYTYSTTSLL